MDMDETPSGIAVIGLAGRFPGASDVRSFWQNLRDGVCGITFLDEEELREAGVTAQELKDPRYVRAAGVLGGVDLFDAPLFGITPREAEVMDPQHRVFLETAWEALEDAGYDPARFPGWIGVYGGAAISKYLWINVARSPEALAAVGAFQAMISNDKDYLTTQVSYRLNLRGPSLDVQTACSTSLVAVHLACQGLISGECDLALAGGVAVSVPERRGYYYQEKGIASPDGYCRPFDSQAAGTIRSNGVGIVVLKRVADALADGDRILAVIKGSAINNDGSGKVGYTAPGVAGQAEVIAAAQAVAGVDPETISYIEAHGTATRLGDPIEVTALTQAFATDKRGFCALGAVKGNIGHLDAAAGVTGLIKTVLALHHGELPASLHYQSPNPEIDFGETPFVVNREHRPWPQNGGPRRAGVSSFGIGGTNAHVVVEEAPPAAARPAEEGRRTYQLLPLSAASERALIAVAERLARHLAESPAADLADVAWTLQMGRRELLFRRTLTARTVGEARARLEQLARSEGFATRAGERAEVAFVFPGQGAQYPGMGRALYREEPTFRAAVDECLSHLEPAAAAELRRALLEAGRGESDDEQARQTGQAQLALFTVQYALSRLWQSLGIEPTDVLGHSVGEFAAACVAGVLPLGAALSLVALRGRLMQALPPGAMLAVGMGEGELAPRLPAELSLAAVNGPGQCVVSGPEDAVTALADALAAEGRQVRRLKTSHAFHSAMIEPMLPEFRRALEGVALAAPRIPYASSLTGGWVENGEVATADYWVRHARETVRFEAGLARVLEEPGRVLLEIGPRQGLAALAKTVAMASGRPDPDRPEPAPPVVAGLRNPVDAEAGEAEQWVAAVGQLWAAGAAIDWAAFHGGAPRRRVPLPTYPFERRRYWLAGEDFPALMAAGRQPLDEWFYLASWKRSLAPRRHVRPASGERCLLFTDGLGLGEALGAALRGRGWQVIEAAAGEAWGIDAPGHYRLRPGAAADHARLWEELAAGPGLPSLVLHLWNVTPAAAPGAGLDGAVLSAGLERSFSSLFHLGKSLGRYAASLPPAVALLVLSNRLHAVESGDRPEPAKAALLGLCRVLPQEQARLRCRSIDLDLPERGGIPLHQVERCLAEIEAPASEATVAWRGSHRWVPSFEKASFDIPGEAGEPALRPGGVYLVTGGLGGIGLEIARLLAESVQARLVLIGRSPVPAEESWGEVLENGTDERLRGKIRRLRELQDLGSELLILAADVADPAALAAVRARAEARFGHVHGVFHAAGIAGGGILEMRSEAEAAAVMAPKIQGTGALAQVFADADLLVLCGSLAALQGGIGQADYAAANAFLDAFATAQAQRGGPRTVAIDWDVWQEVGMAAEAVVPEELRGHRAEQLQEAIRPAEGREVLARILAVAVPGTPQVAVSTVPLAERLAQAAETRLAGSLAAAEAAPRRERHPRPASAPLYAAPATPLETVLAELWQELLGIEPIGRHDDFFEMGGHSLLAIQVVFHLRDRLGRELPLQVILSHPTPARLARALGESASQLPLPSVERLTALQATGRRIPLFCVHPAGGNTFAYKQLMESLGPDQPLFAFQSDGIDDELIDGMSIEIMAGTYIAAMQRERPQGPYHIAGWSMGGLVAYEIAQQLQAAGEEVGLLVLFDTRADTRPEGFDTLPEDETELLYILYGKDFGLSYEEMRARPEAEALAFVVEHAQRTGGVPEDFTIERARRLFDVYMRNRRLMWNYFPQAYPGSMVLFQALERRADDQLPVGMRWDSLIWGKLTTILKPGDHNNLLLRPYVTSVAESLSELLEAFEVKHQEAVAAR